MIDDQDRCELVSVSCVCVSVRVCVLHPLFGNSPTGQTNRRFFALNGSNNADSRMMCLWGFVDTAAHLRGQIPRNPYFCGINWCIQAKHAKY